MFLVDAREALSPRKTGKGRFAFGLIRELALQGEEMELLCVHGQVVPDEWKSPSLRIRPLSGGPLWHLRAAEYALQSKASAYLSITSFIVPWFIGTRFKAVQIIHDMIAFRSEPHERKAKLIERFFLHKVAKTARLVAVSESTKNDLLSRYRFLRPQDIAVCHAGPQSDEVARNAPDHKTILCPATLCPRKNQLRLIRAYSGLPSLLRSKYRLVLVGSRGWDDEPIIEAAAKTEGVEWRNYVSDSEYERLLSSCTVLAYPSLYEGFGLPVLDALQRGTAVLTSDRGSLREVAGKAAYLTDPESEKSIAQGLERILTDTPLFENLRKKGPKQAEAFTWERTAGTVVRVVRG